MTLNNIVAIKTDFSSRPGYCNLSVHIGTAEFQLYSTEKLEMETLDLRIPSERNRWNPCSFREFIQFYEDNEKMTAVECPGFEMKNENRPQYNFD